MATKKNPFALPGVGTPGSYTPPPLHPGPVDVWSGPGTTPVAAAPKPSGAVSMINPAAAPTPAPATDYRANILNDPIYAQQMASLSAGGIQSAADRKASIDRALIQFGEIPNFTSVAGGLGLSPGSGLFQSLGTDVDAATRKAAAGLTTAGLSTTARLATGHKTALDTLMSALAARGIVRSGATGVGTNLENQNYLGSQYDARQKLLDYLSGVQSAWAQSQQQQQMAAAQAAADAAQRQIQMNPGGGGGGGDMTNTPGDTSTPPSMVPGYSATGVKL